MKNKETAHRPGAVRCLFCFGGLFLHVGQLRHNGRASRAQSGVLLHGAHSGELLPAALALLSLGRGGADGDLRAAVFRAFPDNAGLGDDQQIGQGFRIKGPEDIVIPAQFQLNPGLQALADLLPVAELNLLKKKSKQ